MRYRLRTLLIVAYLIACVAFAIFVVASGKYREALQWLQDNDFF
jgi:hypothetical protein